MKRFFVLWFSTLCLTLSSCSGSGDGDDQPNLSSNACSAIGLNTRIINGTACSEVGSSVVELTLFNNDGSVGLCSGTLITSNDVLTAAHCFFGQPFRVFVEAAGQRSTASATRLHPNVEVQAENLAVINDFAIVQLAQPLNLPTLPIIVSQEVRGNDIISIFGYGIDSAGKPGVLRSGEMAVDRTSANHLFARFNGNGSNTCSGDSGGPAIFQGPQGAGIVGVVSSGNLEDCQEGDLSLFANAQETSIVNFITSIVPDLRLR